MMYNHQTLHQRNLLQMVMQRVQSDVSDNAPQLIDQLDVTLQLEAPVHTVEQTADDTLMGEKYRMNENRLYCALEVDDN